MRFACAGVARRSLWTYAVGGVLCAMIAAPPSHAAVVRPMSLAALVSSADLVVRGQVLSVAARWSDGRIVRDVLVGADGAYKGDLAAASRDAMTFLGGHAAPEGANLRKIVHVLALGGEVGEFGQVVSGSPTFVPGEPVLLFLASGEAGGFWCVGMAQGKARLETAEGRPDLDAVFDVSGLAFLDATGRISPAPGKPHRLALSEIEATLGAARQRPAASPAAPSRGPAGVGSPTP